MADLERRGARGRVRWPHVIAAATVSALSATLPSGMLWLSPMLLLAWWGTSEQVWLALGVAWLLVALLAVSGGLVDPGLLALQLAQPAGLTAVGLVFGLLLFRQVSVSWSGLVAVFLAMLLTGATVLLVARDQGPDFGRKLEASVATSLDALAVQVQEQASNLDEEAFSRTVEFIKDHAVWVAYLAPGVMGLGLIFSLWVNLLVVSRLAPGLADLGSLSAWRPPETWIWGLIGAAVLALTRITPLVAVGLNLLLVGAGVYLLAGVAVGAFAARRWGVPGWAYAGILVLVALAGGLPYLVFIGLLDFWLDFRKRWRVEK